MTKPWVMAVVGSSSARSATRAVMLHAVARLKEGGCEVDLVDLSAEPLPLLNPEVSHTTPFYEGLKARVERADVILIGTPDYHGCASGVAKNFLDHFWKEFAGKLFASIVTSFEKGLTVTDQIRTVARQCYAWSLPYGVACAEKEDVRDGDIVSPAFSDRLDMMVRDIRVYGALLAEQRRADLAGEEMGFMARYRTKG